MAATLQSPSRCAVVRLSRRQRSVILCLAGVQPSKAGDVGLKQSVRRGSPTLPGGLPVFDKVPPFSTPPPPPSSIPLVALQPQPAPTLDQELQGLPPLEAQKRLTARVKAARTLQDFATIVAAGGRLVDAICLVAILAGLPRAVQRAALPVLTATGAPPPAMGSASASSSSSSSSPSGPAAPSTAGSVTAGGAADAGSRVSGLVGLTAGAAGWTPGSPAAPGVLLSAGAAAAAAPLLAAAGGPALLPSSSQFPRGPQGMPQLPPPQLSRGSEGSSEAVAVLVWRLVELVRGRLREFDANGLVTVTVGLAKLSCYVAVDASVFRTLLSDLEPRLPGLGTKALANTIWALATAGVRPRGCWLTRFYCCVERQLEAFSGADLANLMWGLAKLDLMPEVYLMDQLVAALLTQLRTSHSVADGATALTCLAHYACRAYNYRLRDDKAAALLAAVQPGLRAAAPGDLVALLHSAVCMSHMPCRPFMLDLYAVLKDRLGSSTITPIPALTSTSTLAPAGGEAGGTLAASDFPRLLWSLSRVDVPPPQSWLREFMEVSTPKLSALRARGLSELIWALACWDARPPPRFLEEFFRASGRRVAEYPPTQIADTLSALAKLGCRAPTPWLAAMLSAFCSHLPDAAAAHDLVTVLESIVSVAADRVWLAAPQQRAALQRLADTAASKFAAYDACSHARLVLALARANCCPGAAWLSQQQASLASAWQNAVEEEGGGRPEGIDGATAEGLRRVYSEWEVQLEPVLAAELDLEGSG